MTDLPAPYDKMRAMLLDKPHRPLRLTLVPIPLPSENDILIRVRACGVCRTDLHISEGELPPHKSSLIMGHQVVGEIAMPGSGESRALR